RAKGSRKPAQGARRSRTNVAALDHVDVRPDAPRVVVFHERVHWRENGRAQVARHRERMTDSESPEIAPDDHALRVAGQQLYILGELREDAVAHQVLLYVRHVEHRDRLASLARVPGDAR